MLSVKIIFYLHRNVCPIIPLSFNAQFHSNFNESKGILDYCACEKQKCYWKEKNNKQKLLLLVEETFSMSRNRAWGKKLMKRRASMHENVSRWNEVSNRKVFRFISPTVQPSHRANMPAVLTAKYVFSFEVCNLLTVNSKHANKHSKHNT